MRKILHISASAIICLFFTSCLSIPDGEINWDELANNENEIELDYPVSFEHPGIMSTTDDISRWREIVETQEQPAYACYEIFAADARSQSTYSMNGPYSEIFRGTYNGTNIQSRYEQDFNAAYQNAVMYAVTGNEAHASKAAAILNAYANTLTAIVGNDQPLLAGIMGVKFMYAAELVRYLYPEGMNDEQFAKVCDMFRNVFVPILDEFMATPAYSNGNWGASVGMSYIAAAVLLDDMDMYRKAIDFYLSASDNGTIRKYLSDTGQCQESGRDQAHTQLGIACLSVTCEIAHAQGTDLYGVLDNRLMKGFEYTSRYNMGYDVPFETWTDVTGKYCNWNVISEEGRGNFRPVYEMVYNHYVNRMKLEMPYTESVLKQIRQEGYYYEHFGFGTFLFNEK